MSPRLKQKLDFMVLTISKMPQERLEDIEAKEEKANQAMKALSFILPDLQCDGEHFSTLENIVADMDDKIARFEIADALADAKFEKEFNL